MSLQKGIYEVLILFCLNPAFRKETSLLTVTFRLLLPHKLGEARNRFEQTIEFLLGLNRATLIKLI